MTIDIQAELDAVQQIGAVLKILDVVGRMTGMGFGLYIASQIAQAHDGTLNVYSNLEETRFVFEMPQDYSS